jgi:hypothetical protein
LFVRKKGRGNPGSVLHTSDRREVVIDAAPGDEMAQHGHGQKDFPTGKPFASINH